MNNSQISLFKTKLNFTINFKQNANALIICISPKDNDKRSPGPAFFCVPTRSQGRICLGSADPPFNIRVIEFCYCQTFDYAHVQLFVILIQNQYLNSPNEMKRIIACYNTRIKRSNCYYARLSARRALKEPSSFHSLFESSLKRRFRTRSSFKQLLVFRI